jgi:hypothetical protein
MRYPGVRGDRCWAQPRLYCERQASRVRNFNPLTISTASLLQSGQARLSRWSRYHSCLHWWQRTTSLPDAASKWRSRAPKDAISACLFRCWVCWYAASAASPRPAARPRSRIARKASLPDFLLGPRRFGDGSVCDFAKERERYRRDHPALDVQHIGLVNF